MPLDSLMERSRSLPAPLPGSHSHSRGPEGNDGGGDDLEVLLIKDYVALRSGLELLLRARGFRVVGVAGSVDEGYRLFKARRPDVTVIDMALGDVNGAAAVRRILELDPDAGVLVYSGGIDRDAIDAAATCGVRGFALKAGAGEELFAAIRAVAAGGVYVDPAVAAMLRSPVSPRVLTDREREVLQLLAVGTTGEQAAKVLFLSPETIRTHIRNAMHKLGATTRVHAVALALSLGEIVQGPSTDD